MDCSVKIIVVIGRCLLAEKFSMFKTNIVSKNWPH